MIVTAPLPEAAWSIGVSTRGGENFYVVTGADAKKADTRILIIPRNRLAQEASTEKSDEGDDQNIIVSPTTTGIIAIRAPLRGESFREQAADFLKQARCEVQKPLEPLVASVTDDTDAGVKPTLIPRKERRTRSRRAAGRENN